MYKSLVIFCLLATAFANTALLENQVRMQAQAQDAVDSALDVLKGLKQANVDAQKLADAINKTQEANMKAEIDDLTQICDSNKAIGDEATERRKYIQSEIETTAANLKWIVQRRKNLIRQRGELQEQRCAASMQFVKALKEHDEALEVVALLKSDIVGIVKEKTGVEYKGFTQVKDQFAKLSAYAHLFNEKAMEQFSQLQQANPAQEVDAEKLEHDEKADDNNRDALKVDHGKYAAAARDVQHRFIDMVNHLEKHLIASVADLKKNEVQAAWDLVIWLQESEKELAFLDVDQAAKTTYIDKLTINVVAAKANEDKVWDIYFDSVAVLKESLKKRELIRGQYAAEKARRVEENLVLDGIIELFIKQVAILNKKSRAATTDHADDGSFNQSQGGANYNDDRVDAATGDVNAKMSAANAAAKKPAFY